MRRALFSIALLALIAGCVSSPALYAIDDGPSQFGPQAERTFAERSLASTREAGVPVRAVFTPLPSYPPELRRTGITGDVHLLLTVGADGYVADARITNDAKPELASLSLDVVRRWRFEPLLLNGGPTAFQTSTIFKFRRP